MNARFSTVGVGGTFDELHKGHRSLILKAFEVSRNVQIGLCTDELARRLGKNHQVASYGDRMMELRRFLNDKGLMHRTKIIPISSPFGTAATSKELEAIVVSRETEPTAKKINVERERSRLRPLEVIVIDMVPAENHVPVSTTRIRHGEIDREGHLLRS